MQINKARLGGLRRVELYGNPGTLEGRSKGGKKTIRLFHQDKELARKAGFIIRKEIKYPERCAELAELIGVILGDGGLSGNHQLTISFNSKTDKEYSLFLGRILRKFGFDAYMHGDQVFVYSISGIKKYFEEIGTHNPKHSVKIIKFLRN